MTALFHSHRAMGLENVLPHRYVLSPYHRRSLWRHSALDGYQRE